ncbi:tol-pal system-associated acyl-CoA thioesterase [Marinicella litoralis]|uniref:Acyl-CoA thioester hydrolase n=1 Tax=Marinicella litoralis TaxID=644220 RepID=A0A4R6XUN8_9GAMM|nr:tol-pal system-associated acyl-CoA thioesterase [Marinicella litoralis]TDR23725.1 acyl-CoA thioester hydrolase [Marinicella litoralis]
MSKYTHQFRVYYEDTDAGGVVYHANYLNFFERTRTEWLRSKGLQQSLMREQTNTLLAIRQLTIDYISPARLDDLLTVSTEVISHSKVAMKVKQTMYAKDVLLATAEVQIVSLNAEKFKPMRFPTQYLEELLF